MENSNSQSEKKEENLLEQFFGNLMPTDEGVEEHKRKELDILGKINAEILESDNKIRRIYPPWNYVDHIFQKKFYLPKEITNKISIYIDNHLMHLYLELNKKKLKNINQEFEERKTCSSSLESAKQSQDRKYSLGEGEDYFAISLPGDKIIRMDNIKTKSIIKFK